MKKMNDLKNAFTVSGNVDNDAELKAASEKPEGQPVILLSSAIPGKKYIIEKINGGQGINSRLNAMGIVPKEEITVIFQTWGGPLTVVVKGVRIALGRGITHKIEVSGIKHGQP